MPYVGGYRFTTEPKGLIIATFCSKVAMAAHCASPSPVDPELFYQWNAPDQPTAISLNINLIDRLSLSVMEAFKSIPKRGLEVGGLLLGRIEAADGPLFVIEDNEFLHSEHLHGPSFSLSPSDKERLASLAEQWSEQNNGEFHIIGLFRSDTRPEHRFDEQDIALAKELFQDGLGVFLLIKPCAGGLTKATFGILQDGTLNPTVDFPFQNSALRDGAYPLISRPVHPIVTERRKIVTHHVIGEPPQDIAAHPAPTLDESVFEPRKRIRRLSAIRWNSRLNLDPVRERRLRRWGWIPLVAVSVAAVALIALRHAPAPVRSPLLPEVANAAVTTSPGGESMALNVEHAGRDLKLTWNHLADVIQQGEYATLLIRDGQSNRELRLDHDELKTGSIRYLPKTGDVQFQFRVFAQYGSATESIRSLDSNYQPARSRVYGDHPSAVSKRSSRPAASKGALLAVNTNDHKKPETPALSAPLVSPSPQPSAAPAPPPQENRDVASTQAISGVAPAPAFSVSVEPVVPARARKGLSRLSPTRLVRRHETADFVPPKDVIQVKPNLSPSLMRTIRGRVSADVHVEIDKNGKVISASTSPAPEFGSFPEAATVAARKWIFTPARKGSAPVASEAILHFRLQSSQVVSAER